MKKNNLSKSNKQIKLLDELIHELVSTIDLIHILESRNNQKKRKKTKYRKLKKIGSYVKHLMKNIFKKLANLRLKLHVKKIRKGIKTSDLRVACILDEFSYNCYKFELNLFQLSKKNYHKELRKYNPHILFVESAWRGSNGQWSVSKELKEIKRLTKICKRRGIVTVFWNKEDPVHFYNFIKKTQHFDYIFTTDSSMIDEYKKRTGRANVFALPFAAQPRIHNPIKEFETREEKAVFAGTFYRNKYPDRLKDLIYMLYAAQNYGLDIYDRNYTINNKFYKFPHLFKEDIKGNLQYKDINKAYKGYKINLNINTVTNSETMFSRRVFEVLACNTPIISNYSVGIEKMFPNIVLMGKKFEDYNKHYKKLFTDNEYYKRISFLGIREVLNKHTYKNRVHTILKEIGFEVTDENKKILILGKVDSDEELKNVIKYYENQSYQYKELLIISDKITSEKYKTVRFKELKEVITLLKEWEIDYIGIFNPYNFYGRNYLSDLIIHDQYLTKDYAIGKDSYYLFNNGKLHLSNPKNEYVFVDYILFDRCIVKREKINNLRIFKEYIKGNTKSLKFDFFSVDSYNFIDNYNKSITKEKINQIEL